MFKIWTSDPFRKFCVSGCLVRCFTFVRYYVVFVFLLCYAFFSNALLLSLRRREKIKVLRKQNPQEMLSLRDVFPK